LGQQRGFADGPVGAVHSKNTCFKLPWVVNMPGWSLSTKVKDVILCAGFCPGRALQPGKNYLKNSLPRIKRIPHVIVLEVDSKMPPVEIAIKLLIMRHKP